MAIALIERAHAHVERAALIDDAGRWSYGELLDHSARAAGVLLDGSADLDGARVAFLVPPGLAHVQTQWGVWRAGGVVVPLCAMHPPPELGYVIDDSDATIVVAHPQHAQELRPLAQERGLRFVLTTELDAPGEVTLPDVAPERNAMLIYTSGTTGKPKGAVTTHAIVAAQIGSIVQAWEWTCEDHILHVLPLHHLHGILNVLCSAMWSGATCEFLPRFDAEATWARIADSQDLTLFMAVPTVYARLTATYTAANEARRARMGAGCQRLRLMVCGSAALPLATLEAWRQLSGHTLLERYGMTEIGMGLGNPLHGERRAGYVGQPFPGVELRLRTDDAAQPEAGGAGEIQVRGPSIFKEYWRRPEATAEVFTDDGWFRTGDIAVLEDGSYRILGRSSVDILKTGGFKVSAIEIENVLRTHDAIAECAVVGIEDAEWGQRVACAAILEQGASLTLEQLRAWGKERLAVYKVPTLLKTLEVLPRNPMGKVQKPQIAQLFAP